MSSPLCVWSLMLSFAPYLDVIVPETGFTAKYTPSNVADFIFSCFSTTTSTSSLATSTAEANSTVSSTVATSFV